jgi:hypothetical protein
MGLIQILFLVQFYQISESVIGIILVGSQVGSQMAMVRNFLHCQR